MKTYFEVIFQMKNELSKMNEVSDNVTDQVEYAIGHCKIALEKLRKLVIGKGFPDRKSEILFFKEIKPDAYGRLLFYHLVFEIESKRRKADISVTKRYLQKCLYKINEYMEEHHVKVQYYRCGFTHLDEHYFLRANSEIPLELKDSRQLLDEEFFTWHDHTFSVILTNDMLADYIREEIDKLEHPEKVIGTGLKSRFQWTGKKIDGGEIIYAFYYAKVVNLEQENDVANIINPFINAHKRGASEQLEGQLGSLKIAISKIISPEIYWICSGNDFSLDINHPQAPKILCLANNPLRVEMYGAVLSLFITRMLKVINRKHQLAASLIFDELPTIYFRGLDTLIATARSNRISTLLGVQTIDQLIRDYGKEQANAITSNIGNVFSGQAAGETAKFIQNRMGKILQERQSVNINRNTQSSTFSTQMDYLVPEGKIATLPQGYLVGQVADNFGETVGQKNFNALIKVDVKAWQREEARYTPIPDFYRFDHIPEVLERNRMRIRNDIRSIASQAVIDSKENEVRVASKAEATQPNQTRQPNQAKHSRTRNN